MNALTTAPLILIVLGAALLLALPGFAQEKDHITETLKQLQKVAEAQKAGEAPEAKTNKELDTVEQKLREALKAAEMAKKAEAAEKAKAESVKKAEAAKKAKAPKPKVVARAAAAVRVVGGVRQVAAREQIVLKDFIMEDGFLRGPKAKTFVNLNADVPADQQPTDELRFMDGGRLSGNFLGLTEDGQSLMWTNAFAAAPIEFGLKGVAYANIASTRKEPVDLDGQAAIQFRNGDRIMGKVVSMNDDTLVLETPYGGKLEIERPMILAINPVSERALVIYKGPENLEGWVHGPNNQAWRVRNGDLEASKPGSIGLNVPDDCNRLRIKFRARWTSYTSFNLAFCSDNLTASGGNYYKMSIRSGSFQLTRVTTEGSSNVWNFHNSSFSSSRGKNGFNYEILYDRKKKNFHLVVDGKVLKQWTEAKDMVSGKNGLYFSIDSNPNVKINEIEITRWDGKVPRSGAEIEAPSTDQDRIAFVNGDLLTGQVKSLDDETLTLKTEIGDMPVAVANVVEVSFADDIVERARRNKGDIRATFDGIPRSSVTVQLRGMKDGKIKGYSEHFGEVELPLDAFRRLEFNIYDDKIEEEDEDLYPF